MTQNKRNYLCVVRQAVEGFYFLISFYANDQAGSSKSSCNYLVRIIDKQISDKRMTVLD